MKIFIFTCFLLFVLNLSAQSIINVPENYSTIQQALNIANSGDSIIVQPGSYKENIIWPNVNGIKLIASGDTTNTIIDGNKLGSVFTISPTVEFDTSSVIKGFKIYNGGSVAQGGGIYCSNGNIKLVEVEIIGSNADNGGGIYFNNSSGSVLLNSTIKNNSCNDRGDGGGIYIFNSNIIIRNSTVLENRLNYYDSYGGGLYAENSEVSIYNSDFLENYTQERGAGLYLNNCTNTVLSNLNIYKNNVYSVGGGLYLYNTNCSVINTNVFLNDAGGSGGGIVCYNSSPLISKCNIFQNTSNNIMFIGGGGMWILDGSNPTVKDSKIYLNNGGWGGGILFKDATGNIDNSIIYKNNALSGGGVYLEGSSDCKFDYTDIVSNDALNGGGLYLNSNSSNLTHCSIVANTSADNGSSIYIENAISTIIIESSTIYRNSSQNNNLYSIYSKTFELDISRSNIFSNGKSIYNYDNSNNINATSNWWNNESGPFQSIQNPSGQGDSVNVFVNVNPWLTSPDTSAPPIPVQNLQIEGTTTTSILLGWDANPIEDLAGYKIYYDTDSLNYFYTKSIDVGNVTTFNLTGVETGEKYYIAITSYDTEGNEGWFSQQISATPLAIPNPPTLISPQNNFSFTDSTELQFSWNLVDYADSYYFQLSKSENFDSLIMEKNNLIDSTYLYQIQFLPGKYYWHVKAKNDLGFSQWSETFSFIIESTTDISSASKNLPKVFSLSQNYPNPFNPNTKISFGIPIRSNVKLKIFDILGQVLEVLINKEKEAGYYNVNFNASHLSSGIYLYSLHAGNYLAFKKMILLK